MTRPTDPSERPGIQNDKYVVDYRCSNCGAYNGVYYPKGTPAEKTAKEPCEYCGCMTLKKEG